MELIKEGINIGLFSLTIFGTIGLGIFGFYNLYKGLSILYEGLIEYLNKKIKNENRN